MRTLHEQIPHNHMTLSHESNISATLHAHCVSVLTALIAAQQRRSSVADRFKFEVLVLEPIKVEDLLTTAWLSVVQTIADYTKALLRFGIVYSESCR